MKIVIGLGNPGPEYEKNRHNAGRLILQIIAKKYDFTDWKMDKNTQALISKGEIGGEKFQFVLPETFMNNSGKSARALIKAKTDLKKLVVIYDDLDLPLGSIKISYDRSSGGHNGLESIIKHVKSQEFVRIRVGLSPEKKAGGVRRVASDMMQGFLLKNFREPELAELKKLSKTVTEALVCLAGESKEKAMSLYN